MWRQGISVAKITLQTREKHILCCWTFFSLYLLFLLSGPAVEYNGQTTQGDQSAPPLLGQHTSEVLRELLGYNGGDIISLQGSGVVECYLEDPFGCME